MLIHFWQKFISIILLKLLFHFLFTSWLHQMPHFICLFSSRYSTKFLIVIETLIGVLDFEQHLKLRLSMGYLQTYSTYTLSWVYTSDFRMRLPHYVVIFYNIPWFCSIKVSNKKLRHNAENACGNRMCKRAFDNQTPLPSYRSHRIWSCLI